MTDTLDKGLRMEEILREYFIELGYFVVRGPVYEFNGYEITDIDLWIYSKTSIFGRQRFNVDIKNKKSPQAMERILWAKGLQHSLGLDGALVATSDSRADVRNFGEQNNVTILDGSLLSKLKNRYASNAKRIAEEDFGKLLGPDKTGDQWFDKIESAKSRILSHFDFDGCNSHLADTKYFAEQIFTVANRKDVALRLFYVSISFFLASIDFVLQDFAFLEHPLQSERLNSGLRFGKLGKHGTDRMFSTAAKIASIYLKDKNVRAQDIVKQLEGESLKMPVEILSEFILKTNLNKQLFEMARLFDQVAYSKNLEVPGALSADQKGLIGAILDFHQIERRKFFEATEFGKPVQSPGISHVAQPELSITSSKVEDKSKPEQKD